MAVWRRVSRRTFVGKTNRAAVLAALGGGQSAHAVKQAYRQWRMLMEIRPHARTFMQLPLNVDRIGVVGVAFIARHSSSLRSRALVAEDFVRGLAYFPAFSYSLCKSATVEIFQHLDRYIPSDVRGIAKIGRGKYIVRRFLREALCDASHLTHRRRRVEAILCDCMNNP